MVGTFVFQPHTRHTGGEGSFPSIYIFSFDIHTYTYIYPLPNGGFELPVYYGGNRSKKTNLLRRECKPQARLPNGGLGFRVYGLGALNRSTKQ